MATVQPITEAPAAMAPSAKPSSGSPEMNLPSIDETKPCLDVDEDAESKDNGEWRVATSPPASQCRKKGVKDRIRGLADKYVSCLQAMDGAGDMRGFSGSGGPSVVHGPQPFQPPPEVATPNSEP